MNTAQQTNFMLWYSFVVTTIYGIYFIIKSLEEWRLSRKFGIPKHIKIKFKEPEGKWIK